MGPDSWLCYCSQYYDCALSSAALKVLFRLESSKLELENVNFAVTCATWPCYACILYASAERVIVVLDIVMSFKREPK